MESVMIFTYNEVPDTDRYLVSFPRFLSEPKHVLLWKGLAIREKLGEEKKLDEICSYAKALISSTSISKLGYSFDTLSINIDLNSIVIPGSAQNVHYKDWEPLLDSFVGQVLTNKSLDIRKELIKLNTLIKNMR